MERREICERIPHAGRMCLLDRLESWDAQRIVCIADSHRDADNPLRDEGRLHAVASVEYAGQAIALHNRLLADRASGGVSSGIGVLAVLGDLRFQVQVLDAEPGDLRIEATRTGDMGNAFSYRFAISVDQRLLVTGEVTAMMISGEERQ